MELKTPPNPSGFNRKPNIKANRKHRGRKPAGKDKAGLSHSSITPEMATYLLAGRLLFGAMQILECLSVGNYKSQTIRNAE